MCAGQLNQLNRNPGRPWRQMPARDPDWRSDNGRDHLSAGRGTGQAIVVSGLARSEEHTSELQSLMRISYAVFCLKKKKYQTIRLIYQPNCQRDKLVRKLKLKIHTR